MPRAPHATVRLGVAAARTAALVATLALTDPSVARAETEVDAAQAAKVEAAYLRHIAEFTTWPEGTFADAGAPLVIGVVGEDHSGVTEIVRRRIEGKGLSAQKRPIVLRRLARPGGGAARRREFETRLAECHLLFVSGSESRQWAELHALLESKAIVTVSAIEGFARRGGMVEFAIDPAEGRVRMYIDVDAVKRARLRLSSKLLDLKTVVTIVENPHPRRPG